MTELLPGIRIVCQDALHSNAGDILSVNLGTETADAGIHRSQNYCTDAYLPKENWKAPSDRELHCLIAGGSSTLASELHLMRLFDSREAAEIWKKIAAVMLQRNKPNSFSANDPLMQRILQRILQHFDVAAPPHFHGVTTDPIGLRTVSYDAQLKGYVGLHVNSWEKMSAAQRHLATIRICLNIGNQPRYLVFINQDVGGMMRLLTMKGVDHSGCGVSAIGKLFMRTLPSYPVARVRIDAGVAYIAPAENMLHDGCTTGATENVYHTAFRGYFKLRHK